MFTFIFECDKSKNDFDLFEFTFFFWKLEFIFADCLTSLTEVSVPFESFPFFTSGLCLNLFEKRKRFKMKIEMSVITMIGIK